MDQCYKYGFAVQYKRLVPKTKLFFGFSGRYFVRSCAAMDAFSCVGAVEAIWQTSDELTNPYIQGDLSSATSTTIEIASGLNR